MAKTGAWLQTELNEVEHMTNNIQTIMIDARNSSDDYVTPEYYIKTLCNLIAELRVYLASHGDHPDDYKPNLNYLKRGCE